MSPSIALRRSPKPGALTATALKVPRILLTTRVDSASPSTSSAMISSGSRAAGLHDLLQQRQQVLDGAILPWWIRMYGSSRTASIRSWSVTMYGER